MVCVWVKRGFKFLRDGQLVRVVGVGSLFSFSSFCLFFGIFCILCVHCYAILQALLIYSPFYLSKNTRSTYKVLSRNQIPSLVNGHKLLFLVTNIVIFQEFLIWYGSQSKFLLFSTCITII